MVIVIGAEKGGVAKTRLATHIAAIAAREGVDVVLLDTDKQGSAISWNRIRKEEKVEPEITVLPLPPNPAREVAKLAAKYELVIVDIGAQNYRTMLECALVSDQVLVPCGADQQEIESTLNVFDALREIGPRHPRGAVPAAVVLTRVSQVENAKVTSDLRKHFASEGIDVFTAHIANRASWLATGRSGRALHELKGKDRSQKAVDEMQAVYDEIIRRAAEAEAA